MFECKRGKVVKKTRELRQVRVQMEKSCQENEGIKPGLGANEEKLSRIHRN
ncbi:hypothetical protein [Bacillus sp. ISL-45]|uniref:hypothetical protein n=1 Tax=Bacillus sp. ISL-45 TaxID=2819128 RepID=UPI001BE65A5A|nr:hypothetical protein [Bacillus sp. ISL-45]